ncbi:MAG: hypothetical protein SynsKO_40580 [Synoicihabitans sp.]
MNGEPTRMSGRETEKSPPRTAVLSLERSRGSPVGLPLNTTYNFEHPEQNGLGSHEKHFCDGFPENCDKSPHLRDAGFENAVNLQ